MLAIISFFQFKVPNNIVPSSIFDKIVSRGENYKEKEDIMEDQHLCVAVYKYVYRNVYFTIRAPVEYLIR